MRVTIAQNVFTETVHDETVVLELGAGKYYGLDPVASRLWQLLEQLGSTEAVVEAALQEFDVERPELARDVADLVRQLAERGLVTLEC